MSALLASASATFPFQGANVTLSCSSPTELLAALREFGINAANDTPTTAKAKPAATPAPAPQAQPAGNVAAATGTQASAPAAASGSAPSGDEATRPTYDDVSRRVLAMCKLTGGREKCKELLKTFGEAIDHANKLKLEDYPTFITKADEFLGAAK